MPRITLDFNLRESIIKMSDGIPGALTAMLHMTSDAMQIDPTNALQEFGPLLLLDAYEIYGSRIWMLYKDVCNQNPVHVIATLRAVQFGIITKDKLDYAIDNYGDGIDCDAVCTQVIEKLPEFAK